MDESGGCCVNPVARVLAEGAGGDAADLGLGPASGEEADADAYVVEGRPKMFSKAAVRLSAMVMVDEGLLGELDVAGAGRGRELRGGVCGPTGSVPPASYGSIQHQEQLPQQARRADDGKGNGNATDCNAARATQTGRSWRRCGLAAPSSVDRDD